MKMNMDAINKMGDDAKECIFDKMSWVEQISNLLKSDKYSEVQEVQYTADPDRTWISEVVRIVYVGGGIVDINVTFNSNGAILKEVVAEVYGGGAIGRLPLNWQINNHGKAV